MTIYILDNDPAECAKALGDKSLNQMIKDIAQVLCNVCHYDREPYTPRCAKVCGDCMHSECILRRFVPMPYKETKDLFNWADWARECKANYLYLVELLDKLLWEQLKRFYTFSSKGKYNRIYKWIRDNVPDLLDKDEQALFFGTQEAIDTYGKHSGFPIVMSKKYLNVDGTQLHDGCIGYHPERIKAYRNYYQAKIRQQIKKYDCGNHCERCMKDKLMGWDDFGALCRCQPCLCNNSILYTNRTKPDWLKL